jgi:hypothetical protein
MNFRGQKLQRMIDSSELCSCVSEKYNPECLEMIMGGQTREAMCVWAYHVDEAPDGGVAGVPEVARRLGDLDGEDGAGDGADAGAAQHSALRRQPDRAPGHRPDHRPHCGEDAGGDGAEHPAREADRRRAKAVGAAGPLHHLRRHRRRRRGARRRVHWLQTRKPNQQQQQQEARRWWKWRLAQCDCGGKLSEEKRSCYK